MKRLFGLAAAASFAASLFAAPAVAQMHPLDPLSMNSQLLLTAITEGRQLVDSSGNCLHARTENPREGLKDSTSLLSRPCQPMAAEQRFVVEGADIKATLLAKESEAGLAAPARWGRLCMTQISVGISGVPSSHSAALYKCGGRSQGWKFENGQMINQAGYCLQGNNPNVRSPLVYANRCNGSAEQKWTWR